MPEIFYVFIGGGIGSIFRYLTGKIISSILPLFPIATLISNVSGSFILGIAFVFFSSKNINSTAYLFLATGICGGFSTFSTFTLESMKFFQSGNYSAGLLNIGLNLSLCMLSLVAGMLVAKQF